MSSGPKTPQNGAEITTKWGRKHTDTIPKTTKHPEMMNMAEEMMKNMTQW